MKQKGAEGPPYFALSDWAISSKISSLQTESPEVRTRKVSMAAARLRADQLAVGAQDSVDETQAVSTDAETGALGVRRENQAANSRRSDQGVSKSMEDDVSASQSPPRSAWGHRSGAFPRCEPADASPMGS